MLPPTDPPALPVQGLRAPQGPEWPSLPALIAKAARGIIARPKGLLSIALAFGTLFAVNDALHLTALAALRARVLAEMGTGGGFAQGVASLLSGRFPVQMATLLGEGGQSFARSLSLQFTFLTAPFDIFHAAAFFALLLGAALSITSLFMRKGTLQDVSAALSALFLPALKLCALFALRTFLWVPLLGIMLGRLLFADYGELLLVTEMTGFVVFLSLAPRYALAPLFLAEGETASASLRKSERQTAGYRWTIMADLSLALLPLLGFCFFLSYFLPAAFTSFPFALPIGKAVLTQAVLVAAIAFYVELGTAVTASALPAIAVAAPRKRGQLEKASLADGSSGFDDLPERVGLEGSAPDQTPIHVGLAQ